ncbi:MAG: transcription-repair coupling factor [Actinobacteria bacterium]|nr:MAG: transcription-repair coupling factor [Actinomycetota bacterium]
MNLNKAICVLTKSPLFKDLVKEVKSKKKKINCFCIQNARPYFVVGLSERLSKPILVITSNEKESLRVFRNIKALTKNSQFLPFLETDTSDLASVPLRIRSLNALRQNENIITVGSINAAMQKLPSFKKLSMPITYKTNETVDFAKISKELTDLGYGREYQVEARGQFSIRGNIIDIFSPQAQHPVRLEFFGDSLESIRAFELLTQQSVENKKRATIYPCKAEESDSALPLSVFDYLSKNGLVVFSEREQVKEEAKQFNEHWQSFFNFKQQEMDLLDLATKKIDFYFDFKPLKIAPGKLENTKKVLKNYSDEGLMLLFSLSDKGRLERTADILKEWGYKGYPLTPKIDLIPPVWALTTSNYTGGFSFPAARFVFITDSDLYVSYGKKIQTSLRGLSRPISSFSEIKPGDYVVHITHGIANYLGLAQKTIQGITREYMLLAYASKDLLLVPTTQLNRVGKYIGAGKKKPKITRLGGIDWPRTKARIKKSVEKLALNLLELYSKRQKTSGFAFLKDTVWQAQLEESFPFNETAGQQESIIKIKQDMESDKPMDRLVCADVGYGKTEIALRAAFKAILDSKQVMFLCPTTILAEQHYNTARARLNPYPVSIAMLSRFKTKSEQKSIVNDFNKGVVDLLIGTHRILQPDLIPKNLGLLIIDEEQRFGVGHKEKIKELRTNVDVLTLTATPIPRTLQMALSGIKDISLISTPPENRQPIATHVGPFNKKLAKEAIISEISRAGQVFFVHNDIKTIDIVARDLATMIPDAKIAVAHGRLSERKLEEVMIDFWHKKYDVLVSTTIIESGLDIPTANTLIIDKAENLGLAQLYQIRGRIGRSEKKAYAYLFFRKQPVGAAAQRLQSLAEFTELGSGFRIALADLEIRGAGNLLGAEQSGGVDAVGFDMYVTLLNEAISDIQGVKIEPPKEEREAKVSAYIPKNYISDETTRIQFYQRLASLKSLAELAEIKKELIDRFGKYPSVVVNLLRVAKNNLKNV